MVRQKGGTPSHPMQGSTHGARHDLQLDRLAQLLDEKGLHYWMDAGSLLGMVREGRLFPGDKDVDLGMWANDLERIEPILFGLRREGYRVARETWHAKTFKYKIYPRKGEEGRIIDLQVYRKSGEYAWSPVHTISDYEHRWYNLPLLLRAAIRWPWRMWLAYHAEDVEVARFPWNRIGWLGTWWIPARHFSKTTRNNAESLPFPHQQKQYLAYRYGDWKRPKHSWVYWRDDGAYRKESPERLIGRTPLQA